MINVPIHQMEHNRLLVYVNISFMFLLCVSCKFQSYHIISWNYVTFIGKSLEPWHLALCHLLGCHVIPAKTKYKGKNFSCVFSMCCKVNIYTYIYIHFPKYSVCMNQSIYFFITVIPWANKMPRVLHSFQKWSICLTMHRILVLIRPKMPFYRQSPDSSNCNTWTWPVFWKFGIWHWLWNWYFF